VGQFPIAPVEHIRYLIDGFYFLHISFLHCRVHFFDLLLGIDTERVKDGTPFTLSME
jgi:hypothetical protein